MPRRLSLIPLVLTIALLAARSATAALDFNREVRPILSDKCFFCHGPDADERKADLRPQGRREGTWAICRVDSCRK